MLVVFECGCERDYRNISDSSNLPMYTTLIFIFNFPPNYINMKCFLILKIPTLENFPKSFGLNEPLFPHLIYQRKLDFIESFLVLIVL